MTQSVIIDRGRGPEIAGTRITVYDIRFVRFVVDCLTMLPLVVMPMV